MCRPLRRRAATGPGGTAWPLGHEAGPASMISACRGPPRLAGRRRTTRRGRDSPSLAAPRIHSPPPRPAVTRSSQPHSPRPESLATARLTEAHAIIHRLAVTRRAPPSLPAARRPSLSTARHTRRSLNQSHGTRRGPPPPLPTAATRVLRGFAAAFFCEPSRSIRRS